LSKSTLVRLVPHQFVPEDSDADRENDDENVSNRKYPLAANCSPSFAFGRAVGTQCRYRKDSFDHEHKEPFRSQIDQGCSRSGNQIPPGRNASLHANNILTNLAIRRCNS
jgi:hypothetical protein